MDCFDDSYDLGIPTPLEMWRQHAQLLEDEVADLLHELRETRRKLRTVIALRDGAVRELDAAKAKLEELKWIISNQNIELCEYAKRDYQKGCSNDYEKERVRSS
jgi:inorganic triphosphatase YgiF